MKFLRAALFALLLASPAAAQQSTVTAGAFAIGRGPGVSGYTSLLCSAGQLAVGQAGNPICRTVSGDWTLNAAGVSTLATVNANVGAFGSATQCTTIAVNAKGLITAASQATCIPAVGSITGLGTGVAAALANNVGSAGAPVVFNGALGTPSSGVGTNLTALNASNLSSGTLPAARTNGHMNGTATNDNAAAGEVGEYVETIVGSGSATALTTNVDKDVATLAIPSAGDWQVWCTIYFIPTATTSVTNYTASISNTLNTADVNPGKYGRWAGAAQVDAGAFHKSMSVLPYRHSLAAGATLHLVANANFTVSTLTAYGIIQARRVR